MTSISNISEHQAAFEESRSSSDPTWLKEIRSSALNQSEAMGLPTTRQEAFRYTDLSRLSKSPFAPVTASPKAQKPDALPFEVSATLHFINGRFSSSTYNDLPSGVVVANLSEAMTAHAELLETHLGKIADPGFHGLTALNTAYIGDAAVVYIPAKTQVEHPIRILFENRECENTASYPRLIVLADASSGATIIEEHCGDEESSYLSNAVTEFSVGPNAKIRHFIWNRSGDDAVHISTTEAKVERDGVFHTHNLCLGGRLVRNDLNIRFMGTGADTSMDCLYLTTGKQHVDNHTRVDHLQPHCTSAERYKGILSGRSHGVFNGKVVVHKDAQKTAAEQSNHNILLSEHAAIDTKPELEIYADDVRCSHGSTVGQLDEKSIFFLRARGIPEVEAKNLLTHAFAHSILEVIEHDGIAEYASQLVNEKLGTMG